MGSLPVPDAEKKRAQNSRKAHPVRDALLKPKTWTTMLTILKTIYGIIRVGAKIGKLFT